LTFYCKILSVKKKKGRKGENKKKRRKEKNRKRDKK
jgi:hypothetical protein